MKIVAKPYICVCWRWRELANGLVNLRTTRHPETRRTATNGRFSNFRNVRNRKNAPPRVSKVARGSIVSSNVWRVRFVIAIRFLWARLRFLCCEKQSRRTDDDDDCDDDDAVCLFWLLFQLDGVLMRCLRADFGVVEATVCWFCVWIFLMVVFLFVFRKLKVCHFNRGTEICNYSYSNTILAVKLNRSVSFFFLNPYYVYVRNSLYLV